jgi:tetratricopeptide (TPR) repeat protein
LDWQLEAATRSHLQQEAIAQQVGDKAQLGLARFNLSEDYRYMRQYTEAEQAAVSALELLKMAQADKQKITSVLNSLGLVAQAQGKHADAKKWFAQAIKVLRKLNQPTQLARALNNLGNSLSGLNSNAEALECFTEAIELLKTTQSEFDKVMVAMSLGTLQFNLGQLQEAEATFRQADTPYLRQSGHIYYRALTANNIGNVLLAQGRVGEAVEYLQGSVNLFRQTSQRLLLANAVGTMGEALAKQNLYAQAGKSFDEALDLLKGFPNDVWAQKLLAKFAVQRQVIAETALKSKTKGKPHPKKPRTAQKKR